MNRQMQAVALVVMLLLGSGSLLAPRGGVQAQIIGTLPTIIVFPTATRTPTPVNIGNFVWDDLDKDGVQDAGEPGIAGVTVQLWNDDKTQHLASAVTNASGNYTLTAQAGPGSYRVRVVLPGLLDTFSPKDASGNDQTDSDINPSGMNLGFTDVITIAPNVISTTLYDAGIIIYRAPTPTRTPTPVNIGNLVWHDLNANGVQDAGEPGVAGVTVQLWNDAKTQLIDSAVTNASGNYTLTAQAGPGSYRVRVVLPSIVVAFAPKDASGSDLTDSDINPSGVNAGFTDVYNIASNVISITHVDAGLVGVLPATATPMPPAATATAAATTQVPHPAMDQVIYLPAISR